MSRITLSVFGAVICLIGSACGTKCSTGPGYRFPITCPGLLDSTKNHCCEISGSFRCCDEEEFARQDGTNDISKPPVLRHKRGLGLSILRGLAARASRSKNTNSNSGVAWGIAGAGIILVVLYYSYRCRAYCPCSNTRHEDDTNVTTDQPAANNTAIPVNPPGSFTV